MLEDVYKRQDILDLYEFLLGNRVRRFRVVKQLAGGNHIACLLYTSIPNGTEGSNPSLSAKNKGYSVCYTLYSFVDTTARDSNKNGRLCR